MSNSDALIAGIDGLTARLGALRAILEGGDAGALAAWNDRAHEDREALLGAGLVGGVGGDEVVELRASVPNRPGVIAELALALGGAGVNILDMALSPSEDNRQGVIALWVGGEFHAERAHELIAGLGFPVARA
jgi:prephenate dehydrogenase